MELNITLTDREKRYIAKHSLERIMNTAQRMGESVSSGMITTSILEDAEMNVQDIEDSKAIASKIWNATRDAIFRGEK